METAVVNNNSVLLEAYWRMLSTLSRSVKLGLASRLTNSVLEEEMSEGRESSRKVSRVKRMPIDRSDAEMEAIFADQPMPEIPSCDASWQDIIKANSGRTIKPVEKWL